MQETSATHPPASSTEPVYTVSGLNRAVRNCLESGFPVLWVEGEISNLARPSSGQLYFSLKDAEAQVRCAMFRRSNMQLAFRADNGVQVLVRARVGLYEPRGEYQLVVEHMEEAGRGALQRAFEALKHKLDAAGLFAAEHKRPLPTMPRAVGLITSSTGAAVRDMLTVLQRRFPALPVILYPVPVQGDEAASAIVHALRLAAERQEVDVLILARGGGSLEDLQAFNNESVAQALFECPIPVVSGVGHETDVTIADFVADQRAPTPSGAAEVVSPDAEAWVHRFEQLGKRLIQIARRHTSRHGQQVDSLARRLNRQHPGSRLRLQAQRLDELEMRLRRAWQIGQRQRWGRLRELQAHLRRHLPRQRLAQLASRLEHSAGRLHRAQRNDLTRRQQQVQSLARALHTVSPLATLERGYAIVHRADGSILRNTAAVSPGALVTARLARGQLHCRVESTEQD